MTDLPPQIKDRGIDGKRQQEYPQPVIDEEPGEIHTEKQHTELPQNVDKVFQRTIFIAQSQMPADIQATIPLTADTSRPVVYLHQVADRDMYIFPWIDYFRTGTPQTGLSKISHSRNTENQKNHVNRLPQHPVGIQPNTSNPQQEQYQMEYPYFTGQAPIPLQGILQPHTNSRYQDQRQ